MKLNSKIIIPIVIAILISWVGNIYIFDKYSLEKPILLNSYLGLPLAEGYNFELSYVSNIYDKDNIILVSFPEINTQSFFVTATSDNNIADSNFRFNRIRIDMSTVFLENGKRLIDTDETENLSLKKIQLITNSGKKYEYDLGKMYFLKQQSLPNNAFKNGSYMSSNSNSGSSTLTTETDIKITELVNPLKDLLSEVCEVNINGTPLSSVRLPLSFKPGDLIEVKYNFKNNTGVKPQFQFSNFIIPLVLKGIDYKGNPAIMNIYINGNTQYYITAKDIKKLLKESR